MELLAQIRDVLTAYLQPDLMIEYLAENPIFAGFCAVCLLTLLIRLPYLCKRCRFSYVYSARTNQFYQDHRYCFTIRKVHGEYRCYIDRTPSFRGRSTANYTPHYWVEERTKKRFICWTGKIRYPAQAKTLCQRWSDATQQFIDTGRPAPGFERT